MWWRNAFPKHLPLPQGPFVPAAMDIMSGYAKENSFIRIYYPSSVKKEEQDKSKWYRWMPHEKYIEGFAHVVGSWPMVVKAAVWYYGGQPLVPVVWEGPIHEGKKFPVIVFSHGFGAARFLSATIGAELASHGYIFAAIEHRETSACLSYYYESEEKVKLNEPSWITHKKMHFGPDHYSVRNEQLYARMAEIKNTLDLLEDLNEGNAKTILPSSFDLTNFKSKLDLSSICMMGHSFGGAASLLTLANDTRLKSGVILDGWMFPIKEEEMVVQQPLLFINTQTFHIESNLIVMDKFMAEPKEAAREIYTIRHTTHETQTDMTHIIGYWLDWFMQKLDPVIGTNINNHLILRFLHKLTGTPSNIEASQNYLSEHESTIVNGTFVYSKKAGRGFSLREQFRSNI